MDILNEISQISSLREEGNYVTAYLDCLDLMCQFQAESNLGVAEMSLASWEIAKVAFCKGDYVMSQFYYEKAVVFMENQGLMAEKALELAKRQCAEVKCCGDSQVYSRYEGFRSEIDPFYAMNGDFHLSLERYLRSLLEKLDLPSGLRVLQEENTVYRISVAEAGFFLDLSYRKEVYFGGQFQQSGYIQLENLEIPENRRGMGLGWAILNSLFVYVSGQSEFLLVKPVEEGQFRRALLDSGAQVLEGEWDCLCIQKPLTNQE